MSRIKDIVTKADEPGEDITLTKKEALALYLNFIGTYISYENLYNESLSALKKIASKYDIE